MLPSLLRRLWEQLPHITVRAFVTNTRENEEMLLRNELDFAVIDNVKGLEALRTVPLGKEEMAVVCRPDHRSGTASRWRSWQESGCCCGKRAAAHGTASAQYLARRDSQYPPFWTAPAPMRC
ncbi:MAG: LysR substrate-binding domain-containing protein [Oscillospiraceae bacterium]